MVETTPETPATPVLEHVTSIHVSVETPLEFGDTPQGRRRTVPITGGHFTGPRLNGDIVPGGADWQVTRHDGVSEIVARYTLRTHDGALINVVNRGLRHGPDAVMHALAAGEPVAPSAYYMRTAPRFDTAAADYDWLNRTLFIARGVRNPRAVVIEVFAVQ